MSKATERKMIEKFSECYSGEKRTMVRVELEKRVKAIEAFRMLHPSLKGRYTLQHNPRASYLYLIMKPMRRPSGRLRVAFRRDGKTAQADGFIYKGTSVNYQQVKSSFDPRNKQEFLDVLSLLSCRTPLDFIDVNFRRKVVIRWTTPSTPGNWLLSRRRMPFRKGGK